MNLNTIVFIVLFGFFFVLLIFIVQFFPVALFKYRMQFHGIEVSWKDARGLHYPTCLKKEFFYQAIEVLRIEDITFKKLCTHFMAGGNLEYLRNTIIELKTAAINYEIDDLLTLNLTARKIKGNITNYQKDGKLDVSKALINWKE